MFDTKALLMGITIASLVFIIRDRKKVSSFFSAIINNRKNDKMSEDLEDIMNNNNISYEEAKRKMILMEISKALKVDFKDWEVNKNLVLRQGDKVSFVDKEVGFIQGDFLGLIKPDVVGYDYLYILRNHKTSTIRQAPISYVKEDTVNNLHSRSGGFKKPYWLA